MKSKSLLSRIFRYSMVMLVLPFLTIFLMYGYTERTVEEQVSSSGKRMLVQFFALIDNVMEDVTQTCISVGNEKAPDQHIQAYLQDPKDSRYSAVEVYRVLKEYRDDRLFDILIYFPMMDQIISSKNGSLATEDYLVSTYGRENYHIDRYTSLLHCDSSKPRISSFVGSDQQTYLCMNMRWFTIGYAEREYIVSIVLSPEYLNSLMIQDHLAEDDTLLLFDAQKKLLLSGDGVMSYVLGDVDNSDILFESEIVNGEYRMFAMPSRVVDGYYAYVTNIVASERTLSTFRVVGISVSCLCLVSTIALLFWSSNKIYSPVGAAMRQVEKMGAESYNRTEHNELEFLSSVIEKQDAETVNLQKRLRQDKHLKRDQYIRALIKGEGKSQEIDINELETINVAFVGDFFRVILIFLQKHVDMDNNALDFVIRNTFEETSRANGYGCVAEQTKDQYILLLNYDRDCNIEETLENLRKCQEYLRQQLGIELLLASGTTHRGSSEVYKSYYEAELALKYKYLLEDLDYISYRDIMNREFNYISSVESTLSRKIISFINGATPELSGKDFVSNIMETCRISSSASMDNIECFKYEMISIINKAFMICGDTEDREKRIQELVMQPTLNTFCIKFAELLEMLRELKQHVSKREVICRKAIEYVKENYRDPQFSVVQLGDMLNLSPYYVSRLFKDMNELTIPEFIVKMRISNAKEQLANTDMSIKDIARDNGFLSSNVFIRTFKKWEGITPGSYREQKDED